MAANVDAFTVYGRGAGSARVRVYEWADRAGPRVRVHGYLGHSSSKFQDLVGPSLFREEVRLRNFVPQGGVIVHREASPFSRGHLEVGLLHAGSRGIFDFDDAIHLDWGRGSSARALFPKASKVALAVSAADVVIAGNDVLADWASNFSRAEIVVIPSCVNPGAYQIKRQYEISSQPIIGWLGSPSQEVELSWIAGPLMRVHERFGAVVEVVGAPGPDIKGLEGAMRRVPWDLDGAAARLATWDLGIMPLRDGLWQRAKCGYKLLQYGAAAVPSIGSPVGVNGTVLAMSGGLAPASQGEWDDALTLALSATPELRSQWGTALRRLVVRDFSYDAWASAWFGAVGLRDPKCAKRQERDVYQ